MSDPHNPVLLAVVGAAHGIKGEVRVKTFTGDPLALADYGPLRAKDGRGFEIVDLRPAKTVVIVRFKGINDRNQAEALNGLELFADRETLQPEKEGEFFHDDLSDFPSATTPAPRSARSRRCRISAAGIFWS